MPKLIIAANRLPLSITQSADGLTLTPSPGGMAAALSPILSQSTTRWVGYTGIDQKIDPTEAAALGMSPQLEPLGIPEELYTPYYNHVANGSLWPVLHGLTPRNMYAPEAWQANLAVNQLFARKIATIANPGDLIWIHDFHLVMLPQLLRRHNLNNPIGFFLHTPFPPPETFQLLPNHQEILTSLQTANLVGLQTPRDLNYFRQSLRQRGKQSAQPNAGVFPVGIDYQKYRQASALPNVRRQTKALHKRLAGKTVILSVSRLDYTKGILEQLRAVQAILPANPRVVYKLIVSPSREAIQEYQDLKQDIDLAVAQINKHYSSEARTPIEYDYRNVGFEELASWYCRADIMLVTPLIDGMNLVAKEYIAAKPTDDGVLILGQHAGAATQLQPALQVDPNNQVAMVDALRQALAMPPNERQLRHQALRAIIQTTDAAQWTSSFIAQLSSR